MKPVIVVTNDDGITSKGIAVLVEVAQKFGNVVVVAPNKPQSGMGHAITIGEPLRVDRSRMFPELDAYECSGTPADCVKLAKNHILKNIRKLYKNIFKKLVFTDQKLMVILLVGYLLFQITIMN